MTIPFSTLIRVLLFEFLPYGAGFVLASRATFRLWLAAQKAPLPNFDDGLLPEEPSSTIRIFRKTAIFSLFAILLVVATFLLPFVQDLRIKSALAYPLILIILGICTRMMGLFLGDTIFQVDKRSIHRTQNGSFVISRVDEASSLKRTLQITGIVLASFIVSLGAIVGLQYCLAIIAAAFSYFIVNRSMLSRISTRGIVIGYICLTMAITSITAFMALYWFKLTPGNRTPPNMILPFLLSQRILKPLSSVLPAMLIALALRFDYQRFLDKSEEDESTDAFTLQPRTAPAPEFGEGVVIPKASPVSFPKVYFTTAMSAWIISYFALLLSASFVGFPVYDLAVMGIGAFLLIFPIIIILLMILAAIRGEGRIFWRYQEKWVVKPAPGAVQLP
ncbi:hypothetical protein M422DRAFT_251254 [Sphaerobolus stellatus SS14]|uniref:Uncharacterized protein n=1 Tax=Sphaerobolus stellatus (strain SS14) TaxID=990650 RepID=A0A0C9W0T2_SPHS4|nr:hypothetical protein M422DRAFT_251254 [Sphaerobolus stellatus SS14]